MSHDDPSYMPTPSIGLKHLRAARSETATERWVGGKGESAGAVDGTRGSSNHGEENQTSGRLRGAPV